MRELLETLKDIDAMVKRRPLAERDLMPGRSLTRPSAVSASVERSP